MNLGDIGSLEDLITNAFILVPVLVGLVEMAKISFKLSPRYVPIASVILGIIFGLLFVEVTALGGLVGIVLGLTASGLWSGVKHTIAGK